MSYFQSLRFFSIILIYKYISILFLPGTASYKILFFPFIIIFNCRIIFNNSYISFHYWFFGYEYVYRVIFCEGQRGALLRWRLFFLAITSWTSKSFFLLSLSLSSNTLESTLEWTSLQVICLHSLLSFYICMFNAKSHISWKQGMTHLMSMKINKRSVCSNHYPLFSV